MSAGPVVLRAAGLSKAWSVPVLREISLSLEAGEVHVLMGSNGAGKSTLAAILGGLIRADAGRARALASADHRKAITRPLGQSLAHASCGPCDRDPDAHGPALYRDFMLRRGEAQPTRIDPKV